MKSRIKLLYEVLYSVPSGFLDKRIDGAWCHIFTNVKYFSPVLENSWNNTQIIIGHAVLIGNEKAIIKVKRKRVWK